MASGEPDRVIAGLQAVREAIRARPGSLRRLLVDRRASARVEALVRFASDRGVARIERVPTAELDRASSSAPHQGVVAVAPALELTPSDAIFSEPNGATVALDGISDPQNFGAVVRCAVALAGAAIVWGEHSSAPLSGATFRASAGAVEHARLCRVPSLRQALIEAADLGASVVGLDANAGKPLAALDLSGPVVLVVGSEHSGLTRGVRRVCNELARIPLGGPIDSLNASVACAIALYEVRKQREVSDS